jgi:hypothetical protein
VSQKKKSKKKALARKAAASARPSAAAPERESKTRVREPSRSASAHVDPSVRPILEAPFTTGSLLSGTFRMAGAIGWRGLAILLLFQLPGAIATWNAADTLTVVLVTLVPQLVAIGAVTDLGLQRVSGAPPDLMGAIVKGLVRFLLVFLAQIISQLIVAALALLLIVPALIGYGGFVLYDDMPALGIVLYVLAAAAVIPCAIPAVRRFLAYQLVAPLVMTGEYRVIDVLDVSRERMQGRLGPAFVPAVLFLLLSSQIGGMGVASLAGTFTDSQQVQAAVFLFNAILDLPLLAFPVVLYAKLARDD